MRLLRERIVRAIGSALAAATIACNGADGATGPAGPAGPPGDGSGRPIILIAAGTASLVAGEDFTSYTAIPGLSTSLTVPAGESFTALIETDGGIQVNSPDPNAFCYADVAVFVDGAQVGSGRRTPVMNNAIVGFSVSTYGFSVETGLAGGTHTITVMAKKFLPDLIECYIKLGRNRFQLARQSEASGNVERGRVPLRSWVLLAIAGRSDVRHRWRAHRRRRYLFQKMMCFDREFARAGGLLVEGASRPRKRRAASRGRSACGETRNVHRRRLDGGTSLFMRMYVTSCQ